MKKVVLVLMLILIISMTGCSKSEEKDAVVEGAVNNTFKIGLPYFTASNDPTLNAILKNIKIVVEAAGGEIIIDNFDLTPDGQVNSVEKLLSLGVDGILIIPMADSILPTIASMCEQNDVYMVFSYRSINDPDIQTFIEDTGIYVGNCYEDETQTAYNAVSKMADLGVKNLAVLGVAKGDTTGDARDRGIEKAASERGVEILGEIRGLTQAADVTKAVQSLVAAYPELDGIFISASMAVGILPATIKVLEEQNLTNQVKVGKIDFDSSMGEYLEKGQLNVVYGGHLQIDPMIATVMLVNQVMGTPLSDKPESVKIPLLPITTVEEADAYYKNIEGDLTIYTKEEIMNKLLKINNNDLDIESIRKIAENFSVQEVAARHKDMF